jgi:hypothetical protein
MATPLLPDALWNLIELSHSYIMFAISVESPTDGRGRSRSLLSAHGADGGEDRLALMGRRLSVRDPNVR